MPHSRSVPLVEVVRSGFVEGVHRGSLVVLDAAGDVVVARGDVTTPVFPRSSNKPLQAAGLVELGYDRRDDLLALAAASHSGEQFHVDGVRRILAAVGLDDAALRTPAEWPIGEQAYRDAVRSGAEPRSETMNCSGKHAAMIATCVAQGWSLDDYRSLDHPLQQHLAGTVERLAGERIAATGIDGCGAPVLALSLTALARSYARSVTAEPGAPEREVADAMRAFPAYVGGTGRDVTELMAGIPGLLMKDGAEGVLAAALPDGRAFALKVDDGAERPRPLLATAVLRSWGIDADVLSRYESLELRGGGVPVGSVRVVESLLA